MEIKALWPLTQQLMFSFGPFYQDEMAAAIQEVGAENAWFPLALARGAHPQPFTMEDMLALNPYANPDRLASDLEKLAGLDLLERVSAGAYALTDEGLARVEAVFEAAHRSLAEVAPLSEKESRRLTGLLDRAVSACLRAEKPVDKYSLKYSRWTDPGSSAPPAPRIDQYLTDLARYRDDAHVAAWKPLDISGPAWEALTFLWREEIDGPAALAERLPYRGYDAAAYAGFLDGLVSRGWVTKTGDGYAVTDSGRAIRQEAEDATEAFFAVAWSALTDDELAELKQLMSRARDTLNTRALRGIWELAGEVSRKIFEVTRPVVVPLAEKHALDQRGDLFVLINARQVQPEPIRVETFSVRTPYNHPSGWRTYFERLAEAGWLAEAGESAFTLTTAAEAALDEIEGAFYRALAELPGPSQENVERLAGLLDRLVEASLDAPEPADTPRLEQSHRGRSKLAEAPLARVDQALDDLGAFRDDSHIAAWRAHDLSAEVWEAFTYVLREQANTPAELAETLTNRNHTAETYRDGLEDLARRGWLERQGEGYRAKTSGREIHQRTEEETDRYFFGPWAALAGHEINGLRRTLVLLGQDMQEQVPEPTPVA